MVQRQAVARGAALLAAAALTAWALGIAGAALVVARSYGART
ncbi:hypothetical protein [Microbacterium sp. KNMS]